jgi:hypothetical protein
MSFRRNRIKHNKIIERFKLSKLRFKRLKPTLEKILTVPYSILE